MKHLLEICLVGIPLLIAILNYAYRDRSKKPALLLWLLCFAVITAVAGVVIHFDKTAKAAAAEKKEADRWQESVAQNEAIRYQLNRRNEFLKQSLAVLTRSSRLLLSNQVHLGASSAQVSALITNHTEVIDGKIAEVWNLLSSTNNGTDEVLRDRCRDLEVALSDYQRRLSSLTSTNQILGNSSNTGGANDGHELAALKEKYDFTSQELAMLKQNHELTSQELAALKKGYEPTFQELLALKKKDELTFQLHTNFIHTALNIRKSIMERGLSGANAEGLNVQLRDSIFLYHNRLLRLQPCGHIAGVETMRIVP
jgi:hypothetical protein